MPQTVTVRGESMTNYRMEKRLEPAATTPHTSLVEQYQRQFAWRDWSRALALCPITHGEQVLDLGCGPGDLSAELAFDGPASPEVLKAWRARFARMGGLKSFLGKGFAEFADSFIRALESPQHRALCRVMCCVGRRG